MPLLAKVPGWAWGGGFMLALVAGWVNVVCILAASETVSHMTGNSSELAIQVIRGDGAGALKLAGLIGAFLLGAIVGGFVIQDSTLRLGRRYGVALMIESGALLVATVLLHQHLMIGIDIAAMACGLQNAMATTYSGTIIRTTHLSGVFTDLGILLGHRLRGLPADTRRIRLFLMIIAGFVSGGLLGALGFHQFGVVTLAIPALITGAASAGYVLIRLQFGK